MESTLKELIQIVKTGSRVEVREAQRKIEHLWNNEYRSIDRTIRNEDLLIFIDEIVSFEKIKDVDHQSYFISILKWPFMAIGEEHFREWSSFVLDLIVHPSGKIRQSIIHATDYLFIGSMYHASIKIDPKSSAETQQSIKHARLLFGDFVAKVQELVNTYYEPKFSRYKYVQSLPVGIYKSLQKLLVEVLLRSESYEQVFEEYLLEKNQICEVADNSAVLPQIKFKYLKLDLNGEKLTYPNLTCNSCGKKDIPIGATLDAYSKKPKVICEDCAIDDYQKRYGFKSREAAMARRRRVFDVGYLFQEMIVDRYMFGNRIRDYNELDVEDFQSIGEITRNIYNAKLSREEKLKLENEPNQIKIETRLRKLL